MRIPFLEITDLNGLASCLGIPPKNLSYIIYYVPDEKRYHSFNIPKKDGSKRRIDAPNNRLKAVQRSLANLLLEVYPGKFCVHGYTKDKSIFTNANQHTRKRWVINIDLKDFFPSIHFGRIKGMFGSAPFNFNEKLSRELANLCCFNNKLPQGAPTSPVVSNIICWKLDNNLYKLAKECRCSYSRYADDITFSGNLSTIPERIGSFDGAILSLSNELLSIIIDNSFDVNYSKCRVSWRNNRQEVTGLIVNNSRPNVPRTFIRQIRAMLHACERYGLKSAAHEHYTKYKRIHPEDECSSFINELAGKISYIRFIKKDVIDGVVYDSRVFAGLRNRLKAISPTVRFSPLHLYASKSELPVIMGEGKTDWRYLKRALDDFQEKGEFKDLKLFFHEYANNEPFGCSNLFRYCKNPKANKSKNKVICVFDRDVQMIVREAQDGEKCYKYWGDGVYSVVIPVPRFRAFDSVCIEQYFTDEEIMTKDSNDRRLFLSTEFDATTGVHKIDKTLYFSENGKLGRLKSKTPRIIDSCVYNEKGDNVAMPKNDFAFYVYEGTKGFDRFSFESFRALFDIIREILAD